MIKELQKKYRYPVILMSEMVRKDYKIKYQDSYLGFFWSVLRPLFLFAILYAVFAVGLRVGSGVEYWPVALLAGVVVWQFFTDVTKNGLRSVVSHGGLLRKISLPRYTIVVSGAISAFLALLINSVVVMVFAAVSGVSFLSTVPLVFIGLLQIFAFSIGLAFFLSATFVRFRDIEHIWEILLRGLFYASAILFPISTIASSGDKGLVVAQLLLLNPAAQVIQDIRRWTINPEIETLWTLSNGNLYLSAVPYVLSVFTLFFGAWYFRKKSPYFAEDV